MSFLATILILASAPSETPPLITGPSLMKSSEIRAYNASLTRDHPNYIRCVSDAETGSLVKRNQAKVCRTNQEWAKIESEGNENARETADRMRGMRPPDEQFESLNNPN